MPKLTRKSQNIPDDFKRIVSSVFDETNKSRKQRHKPSNKFLQKISSLAEPKQRIPEITDDSHWRIKKSTLDYKPSKRIKKLAKPKWISPKINSGDLRIGQTTSYVTPQALNYRATSRILELARPKGNDVQYLYG